MSEPTKTDVARQEMVCFIEKAAIDFFVAHQDCLSMVDVLSAVMGVLQSAISEFPTVNEQARAWQRVAELASFEIRQLAS